MTARPAAPAPRVVPAGPADLDVLGQVIADAFQDLPQSQWLIADPAARRQILPGYFRLLAEHALASGVLQTTADRSAAALWLPAGRGGPAQPAGFAARLAAATGRWAERFAAFDAALDRHHPPGPAHRHLAILAVRPDGQGQGTGTALLRAQHDRLDRRAEPAYLEAAEWRSRQFYRRHGYLPSGLFYLPGGGPAMWPMWRPPRPAQDPATARTDRPYL
jgi:GNAT superfamily N-acetyltransferase